MPKHKRDLRKVAGEEQAKRLIKLYRQAESGIAEKLQQLIAQYGSDAKQKPSFRLLKQQIKAIQHELKELDENGQEAGAELVEASYQGGFAAARKELKKAGLVDEGMKAEMSGVHKKALAVYSEQVQTRLADLVTTAGRTVSDIYRTLQLNTVMSGAVAGTETLRGVQAKMERLAENGGIVSFIDNAGHKWNMATYVEMLSRTTLMQVHNQATWNEFAAHGEDLIQISYHSPTCDMCAPWNGKVLSLTGKTPGYPTLSDAESAGLFHPNCRHASSLYVEENAPEESYLDMTPELEALLNSPEAEDDSAYEALFGDDRDDAPDVVAEDSFADLDTSGKIKKTRGHLEPKRLSAAVIKSDFEAAGIKLKLGEASDIHDAIREYSGSSYELIRAAQKAQAMMLKTGKTLEEILATKSTDVGIYNEFRAADLKKRFSYFLAQGERVEKWLTIAPAYPIQGDIYRGVHGDDAYSRFSSLDVGERFGDGALLSATTSTKVQRDYGHYDNDSVSTVFINFERGGILHGASIRGASNYDTEFEVLINKDAVFEVTAKQEKIEDRPMGVKKKVLYLTLKYRGEKKS